MILKVPARAKINLTLDVLWKRPDGYHEVEMVMQSIELHDQLEFSPTGEDDISLAVVGSSVPPGEDNLVYRAASLLRAYCKIRTGVHIRLVKNIPVEAGLGGGSADAAVTLVSLNKMWGLGLSLSELLTLGEQLGSDVPFCLVGGTALAKGRGEKLEQLSPCPRLGLVLVKPPFGISTASVYGAFSTGSVQVKPDSRAMSEAIFEGSLSRIAGLLANALEPVAIRMHPDILSIKKKLIKAGAINAVMSGSGPTVFGLAADLEAAHLVAGRYQGSGEQVLVSGTFNP